MALLNIENKKQMATILLAIGLGLVAAFMTSQYVSTEIKGQTKILATEYAKQTQAYKQEIDMTKRGIQQLIQQQQDLQKQINERPVITASAGPGGEAKPVVSLAGFTPKIPPDKRAITIQIDSLMAVGGLISPGDYVDVISHLNVPEQEGQGAVKVVTTVLFQNIQVLAIDTNYKPVKDNEPDYTSQQRSRSLIITLALTAKEASLLTFAQANGRVQLTLRPPAEGDDTQIVESASWEGLADYVLEKQGTEIQVPMKNAAIRPIDNTKETRDEIEPVIQIFRSGRQN